MFLEFTLEESYKKVLMQQLSLPLDLPSTYPDKVVWFQEMLHSLGVSQSPALYDEFGKSLRSWVETQRLSPIKTLSLFSGGGGLDIAFHDAGFDIVQMVELEAKYVQTLEKNSQPGKWLQGSQPICVDIRKFFPTSELKVDFIIGGPPCQTFSAAGRRASGVAGTSDTRGTLFQEYVRLLKTLQPKGFLFENVYGITGSQKGQDWKEIQNAFEEVGYTIHFRVLDAADYGVPQHRERLFIVGLKEERSYLFPYPTHGPDSPDQEPFYSAKEATTGVDISDAEAGISGRYGHLLTEIPPGLNYSFYTAEMGHPNPVFSWRSKFSDFLYKADPEMPVRTIKAQGGQYTGPFSWENRKFTIAELKRLQTIPDAYEIVGNRQVCIEQIGNSVPPQLGRILALSILDQVMGVALPFPMYYLPASKQLGFRQRKRQLTEIYAQKAKGAIALLTSTKQPTLINSVKDGQVLRFLSSDFTWTEQKVSDSVRINLKYELNNSCWTITAQTSDIWKPENKFFIDVLPAWGNENWVLGVSKVKLSANDLDQNLFIGLWKAFEEKLLEMTGMADLVQLSGYYQYNPRMSGVMTFHPELKVTLFWRVVQCVVRGIGVATQLSAEDLASLWGVKAENVFSYLKSLRTMGYEVRNYNTNPQIPKGEYLIPYAFPTLTPRSVQLRKNLGDGDE